MIYIKLRRPSPYANNSSYLFCLSYYVIEIKKHEQAKVNKKLFSPMERGASKVPLSHLLQ